VDRIDIDPIFKGPESPHLGCEYVFSSQNWEN